MYFDRDDVALPNFSRFFLERSVKERDQAEKLLDYQNMRGGRVLLQTIAVNVQLVLNLFEKQVWKHLYAMKGEISTPVHTLYQKPSREDWKGGLDAMTFSLDYQKTLNTCILDVHRRADSHTDPHVSLHLTSAPSPVCIQVHFSPGLTKPTGCLDFSSSSVTSSSSTLSPTAMTPSKSWEIIREA